jgi:hypothetical protein
VAPRMLRFGRNTVCRIFFSLWNEFILLGKFSVKFVTMLIMHCVLFKILSNWKMKHSIDYPNHGYLETICIKEWERIFGKMSYKWWITFSTENERKSLFFFNFALQYFRVNLFLSFFYQIKIS